MNGNKILEHGDVLLISYDNLDEAGYYIVVLVDSDDCRLIHMPSMNRYMEENIYGWTLNELKLYCEDDKIVFMPTAELKVIIN